MVIVPGWQRPGGSVHQSTPASLELVDHVVDLTDDRKLIEYVISDQRTHFIPLALLRQPVQFGLQVTPAMHTEYGGIGRRRAVEGDLLAGG